MTYPVPHTVRHVPRPPDGIYGGADEFGESGWLEWAYVADPAGRSPPIENCLREFIDLAQAPLEDVVQFAERWGVLGICEHWRPSTHAPACWPIGGGVAGTGERLGRVGWEPVHSWYRYAREARGIVTSLARLSAGEPPSEDHWRAIERPLSEKAFGAQMAEWRIYPERARQEIARRATDWLQCGQVTPRIRWDPSALEFSASVGPPAPTLWGEAYRSLFGVLAVQLAAAVCSPHGMYRCSECGDFYSPERKPRVDRENHYCPDCARGDNAAKRRSARKHRARARAAEPAG